MLSLWCDKAAIDYTLVLKLPLAILCLGRFAPKHALVAGRPVLSRHPLLPRMCLSMNSLRLRFDILRAIVAFWVYSLSLSLLVVDRIGRTDSACAAGPEVTEAEKLAFFEKKIRPVLESRCLSCHGDKKNVPDGGLRLDRAVGWRQGGDSGPAVVPGDSAKSLIVSAIHYESLEMPPDGRLPDEVIADFKRWIDDGAIDPRTDSLPVLQQGLKIDWEVAKNYWAFQPPRASAAPDVVGKDWLRDPVDHYVLAKLEEEGLTPAPDADPLVRLRRLAFDVTGLPPSPELISTFRSDPSEQHWGRVVDEMLHSPEFAEHWARHWLDIARYADSNGSDFNATFHDAWRYRDFVIRSFAEDKPFDRFVVQQLAGDLMPADDPETLAENLVATGFLMLGAKMLSERDKAKLEMDVVDDMIDTVGRSLLGLTLGCARCHDHKFDPIPTDDYYALAGIFKSTQVLDGESQKYVSTWHKRPLPVAQERSDAHAKYQKRLAELTKALEEAKERVKSAELAKPVSAGSLVIDDSEAELVGDWLKTTYTKPFHGNGYVHDQNRNKGKCEIRFPGPPNAGRYEVRIAFTAGGNRASNVPVELNLGSSNKGTEMPSGDAPSQVVRLVVNQRESVAIEPYWHSLGVFDFCGDQRTSLIIRNTGTDGFVLADAVAYLPEDQERSEQAVLVPEPSLDSEAERNDAKLAVKKAEKGLKDWEKMKPDPLPMAMAVRDRDAANIADTFVCIRGEVDKPGATVPRGFLRICSEPSAGEIAIPTGQSGRMELAAWITDPDNPLTARVIVNRVWLKLFGEGLVRTPDNFGSQGARPTHPELLDHLAVEFVRDGWSIRRLIRRLVMTRTYQQAALNSDADVTKDPDNRWLSRAARRRLPVEAMRDTLLLAADILDYTPSIAPMSGFGVLVSQNVATPEEVAVTPTAKRSIYLPIIRGELPSLFVTFDFADPDLIVGRRESTNVPAQGLAMLNNPEVREWCDQIAARLLRDYPDDPGRLTAVHHLLLHRDPFGPQAKSLLDFVASYDDQRLGWAKAVQAMIASTEFRFLD